MFRSVGSGTGPTTLAPVRWTCSTMSRAATSSIRWSYARSLIRIFGPAIDAPSSTSSCSPEPALLHDLRDATGPDGAAALADREAQALLHRDRRDQLDRHLDVVPRHHHLDPAGEVRGPGDVGRAEVELGAVAVEERGVAPTLLLGEHVDLGLEVRVRGDRAGLGEDLAALDVFLVDPPKEHPDVVPGAHLVQELAEHLQIGRRRLAGVGDPDDLDLGHLREGPALDPARDDRAAPGDREDVLDRHQEGPVDVADRLGAVAVAGLQELVDRRTPGLVPLEGLERRDLDHRDVIARELVGRKELADLELDEV